MLLIWEEETFSFFKKFLTILYSKAIYLPIINILSSSICAQDINYNYVCARPISSIYTYPFNLCVLKFYDFNYSSFASINGDKC